MTDIKIPYLKEWWILWFWEENFDKEDPETGCLNWQKSLNRRGYGRTSYNGCPYFAHRMAYFIYYGVDPGDFVVRHKCHNPRCCNPLHLELGTHADNSRDMVEAGRSQKGDKHWMKRHPDWLAEWKKVARGKFNLPENGENHPCTVLTAERVSEIKRLSALGASNKELAEKFHVTHSNISAIILGKSWTHIEGQVREKDGKFAQKLTEDDVRAIRKRALTGETKTSLARSYNVGSNAIFKIVNRLSWKHIE